MPSALCMKNCRFNIGTLLLRLLLGESDYRQQRTEGGKDKLCWKIPGESLSGSLLSDLVHLVGTGGSGICSCWFLWLPE